MYVMRAAQSKGIADLAAFFPAVTAIPTSEIVPMQYVMPRVWLVQCKRGTGRMAPAEREELIIVARAAGAEPILAKTGPNGRGIVFVNLTEEE